jgi:pyruvate dehydrogenase E1 component beta subunit
MALISYREALNQALREEMDRDPRVFIIGAGVGYLGGRFGVTAGLLAAYGEKRVRDVPLSQSALIAAAVGASIAGLRPIVEFTGSLSARDFASVIDRAVPIVIRIVHTSDAEHLLKARILTVAPATPADAKGLLKAAVRQNDPVLFVEHSRLYDVVGEVPDDEHLLTLRKGNRI